MKYQAGNVKSADYTNTWETNIRYRPVDKIIKYSSSNEDTLPSPLLIPSYWHLQMPKISHHFHYKDTHKLYDCPYTQNGATKGQFGSANLHVGACLFAGRNPPVNSWSDCFGSTCCSSGQTALYFLSENLLFTLCFLYLLSQLYIDKYFNLFNVCCKLRCMFWEVCAS